MFSLKRKSPVTHIIVYNNDSINSQINIFEYILVSLFLSFEFKKNIQHKNMEITSEQIGKNVFVNCDNILKPTLYLKLYHKKRKIIVFSDYFY